MPLKVGALYTSCNGAHRSWTGRRLLLVRRVREHPARRRAIPDGTRDHELSLPEPGWRSRVRRVPASPRDLERGGAGSADDRGLQGRFQDLRIRRRVGRADARLPGDVVGSGAAGALAHRERSDRKRRRGGLRPDRREDQGVARRGEADVSLGGLLRVRRDTNEQRDERPGAARITRRGHRAPAARRAKGAQPRRDQRSPEAPVVLSGRRSDRPDLERRVRVRPGRGRSRRSRSSSSPTRSCCSSATTTTCSIPSWDAFIRFCSAADGTTP